MIKSKGHICFHGAQEFYQRGGEVFRADISSPLDVWGYRFGRFECSETLFARFRSVILGPIEGVA